MEFVIFMVLLYFLPTIVAIVLLEDALGVFLVNFFLGWTVIGWWVAMIWAVAERKTLQVHRPITLPVLEKMRLAAADNVLDVGCGAGWLSRRLAKHVPQGRVVGMDVSDEMIRCARRASVDVENLMFVTGEVEEIPWEPN